MPVLNRSGIVRIRLPDRLGTAEGNELLPHEVLGEAQDRVTGRIQQNCRNANKEYSFLLHYNAMVSYAVARCAKRGGVQRQLDQLVRVSILVFRSISPEEGYARFQGKTSSLASPDHWLHGYTGP